MSNSGSPGFLGAMMSGLRLRCPACEEGPMGDGRRLKDACPRCGWRFFRLGDGDWLVTWIVAYAGSSRHAGSTSNLTHVHRRRFAYTKSSSAP